MTDDMMHLRSFAEETPDAHLRREMIRFAAERLMELGAGAQTGAAHGEKSALWPVQRIGFLAPRRVAEKALTAVFQEAYIQGVSTRSVDALLNAFASRHLVQIYVDGRFRLELSNQELHLTCQCAWIAEF
jgi:putative transposase